jgi:hypothetical protein
MFFSHNAAPLYCEIINLNSGLLPEINEGTSNDEAGNRASTNIKESRFLIPGDI